MRKISLVLALILVLTCGVFAACSEDPAESSAPATSETSKTESKPADDSSAPADDSSAPADESSEAPAPEVNVGTENLAAGKSYTTADQFRMGGADVGWGWDPNAPICYLDEPGSLTDGVIAAADTAYDNTIWAGWTGVHPDYATTGYAWITIDLGESKDLAKFVAHLGSSKLDNGIGATNMTVEVLVSEDGETWTSVGDAVPADDPASCCIATTIEGAGSGQYVQFRFSREGWMFVSEVEVYA
jgi:hypothetical protein